MVINNEMSTGNTNTMINNMINNPVKIILNILANNCKLL